MYGDINPVINIQKLRASLIAHEGKILKPYIDSIGKMTIGVGRNLADRGISNAECAFMLDNDIEAAISDAEGLACWHSVENDDVRARVIIEMVFNLGKPHLLSFTKFLAAVERQDWPTAASQMMASLWAKEVNGRAVTLANMMKTGQDPSSFGQV